VRSLIYVVAVGVVAGAAVVAARSMANRGRSPQDRWADDDRAAFAAAAERSQARVRVAVTLIHGDLTVSEAVARFREMLADDPISLRVLSIKYPDAPIDELAARQAAGYVDRYGATNPARRDELVRQLEALAVRQRSLRRPPPPRPFAEATIDRR
jgi:hypothetical protein